MAPPQHKHGCLQDLMHSKQRQAHTSTCLFDPPERCWGCCLLRLVLLDCFAVVVWWQLHRWLGGIGGARPGWLLLGCVKLQHACRGHKEVCGRESVCVGRGIAVVGAQTAVSATSPVLRTCLRCCCCCDCTASRALATSSLSTANAAVEDALLFMNFSHSRITFMSPGRCCSLAALPSRATTAACV